MIQISVFIVVARYTADLVLYAYTLIINLNKSSRRDPGSTEICELALKSYSSALLGVKHTIKDFRILIYPHN